ncbi:hypothetical protein ACU8KH_03738 [Lachancea thermotolerans]
MPTTSQRRWALYHKPHKSPNQLKVPHSTLDAYTLLYSANKGYSIESTKQHFSHHLAVFPLIGDEKFQSADMGALNNFDLLKRELKQKLDSAEGTALRYCRVQQHNTNFSSSKYFLRVRDSPDALIFPHRSYLATKTLHCSSSFQCQSNVFQS